MGTRACGNGAHRRDAGEIVKPKIENVMGLVKSAIGDTVDEVPYRKIRTKLWKILAMLYVIRQRAAKGKKPGGVR